MSCILKGTVITLYCIVSKYASTRLPSPLLGYFYPKILTSDRAGYRVLFAVDGYRQNPPSWNANTRPEDGKTALCINHWPQVCSVLVWSVSRSLHHIDVIAGSTQELYTCLFRQMARLLLKISLCLAYAAQPAMILRCISLSWFFSLRL